MTSDDITRLTPLVADLQKRGVVATYATTSWPLPDKVEFDSDYNAVAVPQGYAHAFRLRSHGLHQPLIIEQPFTEDELVRRLATAEARQNHGAAIEATYALSKDALIRDLASVYASRLLGRDLPVPSEVTIKDLRVPLLSQ
jgi:hypothetical protein